MLFENYTNKVIVYRGIDNQEETKFLESNDINILGNFWTESKYFAEDYGDTLVKAELTLNNVFDSIKKEDIQELYNNGIYLTDNYINGTNNQDEYPTYDFEKEIYPTAEDYINSPNFGSETWELIEGTDGALDYILGNCDICIIYEGGYKNYYVDNNSLLKII